MKLTLPLRIPIAGRKDFILNLNNYRNSHHMILAEAKRNYTAVVWDLAKDLRPVGGLVKLRYEYFHSSSRKIDVANPCSIIDKFTCDALTKAGIWGDDDTKTVREVSFAFGGVDKENPRCDLFISKFFG